MQIKTTLGYHSHLPDCQHPQILPKHPGGEAAGKRVSLTCWKKDRTIQHMEDDWSMSKRKMPMDLPHLNPSSISRNLFHQWTHTTQSSLKHSDSLWRLSATAKVWKLPKSLAINPWLKEVRYFSVECGAPVLRCCKEWEKISIYL